MKSFILSVTAFLFGNLFVNAQGMVPDSLFGGGDGMVFHSIFANKPSQGNAIAVQEDHKILVAGYTLAPDGNYHGFVARYNEDGSFDNSFNGIGNVVITVQQHAYAVTVQVQPDG